MIDLQWESLLRSGLSSIDLIATVLCFWCCVFCSYKQCQARRNTVFLCFGYVAAYAPVELIPSRAEVTILTPLKPIWKSSKSLDTKMAVTKTIDLIGKALHPSRLTSPYVLPSRDELVELLLDYISPAKKDKNGKVLGPDNEAERQVTHDLRAQGNKEERDCFFMLIVLLERSCWHCHSHLAASSCVSGVAEQHSGAHASFLGSKGRAREQEGQGRQERSRRRAGTRRTEESAQRDIRQVRSHVSCVVLSNVVNVLKHRKVCCTDVYEHDSGGVVGVDSLGRRLYTIGRCRSQRTIDQTYSVSSQQVLRIQGFAATCVVNWLIFCCILFAMN
jgi:hypothetical protein